MPLFVEKQAAILIVWALIFFLSACAEDRTAVSPVFIRINGKGISLRQFQEEFRKACPLWEQLSAEQKTARERALVAELIDRQLVLTEAERLGVRVPEEKVEKSCREFWSAYPPGERDAVLRRQGATFDRWKQEEKQRLLLKEVVEKAVFSSLQVTDEEVEDYYRDNFNDFSTPEEVRARQILVASEEKARQVLALLRRGEPFDEVARKHSLSPDGRQGGDLGFFPRGQMPEEFDAVVFSLTPGRISDIVRSPYGFHIFLVEEHRQATQLSLEKIRSRVESILLERKKETAYNNWLARLRSRAFIDIDWSLLQAVEKKNLRAQN